MDSARDAGILALVVVVVLCLSVFLLRAEQPTTTLVDFLMPSTAAVR
jgi:hypothetical protein